MIAFLIVFSCVVFSAPDTGGYVLEHANFETANTMATPEHIAPVWYFTPFYAILRAVPSKLWGAILMGAAVFISINWLVYVYAIATNQVVQASMLALADHASVAVQMNSCKEQFPNNTQAYCHFDKLPKARCDTTEVVSEIALEVVPRASTRLGRPR